MKKLLLKNQKKLKLKIFELVDSNKSKRKQLTQKKEKGRQPSEEIY